MEAHPYLVGDRGLLTAALDSRLGHDLFGARRLVPLLASAIQQAVSALDPKGLAPDKKSPFALPLLLALPETRPGFSEEDAKELVASVSKIRASRMTEISLQVEIAGRGHAGVLRALETASKRLAKNDGELCLVAGADSYFEPRTLAWLIGHRQIAAKGVRSGFRPGEAAGALLVADNRAMKCLHLSALASLRGIATTQETKLIKSDEEGLGEALTRAIAQATSRLKLPEEAIDAVYCDINGERYRTEEWAFALLRNQRVLRDSGYEAPTDCWGDIGAASPALGVVMAVQSWARRYSRGPRALVWGSSEGGLRGAAVLECGHGGQS